MSATARSNSASATAHAARLFPMRRIEGRKLTVADSFGSDFTMRGASAGPRRSALSGEVILTSGFA